jgi:hypothetical protein
LEQVHNNTIRRTIPNPTFKKCFQVFFSPISSAILFLYYVALLWEIVFGVVQPWTPTLTPTLTAIFDIIGTVETTVVTKEWVGITIMSHNTGFRFLIKTRPTLNVIRYWPRTILPVVEKVMMWLTSSNLPKTCVF